MNEMFSTFTKLKKIFSMYPYVLVCYQNWLNNEIFFITYSINNFLLNFKSYSFFIISAFIKVVLSEKC